MKNPFADNFEDERLEKAKKANRELPSKSSEAIQEEILIRKLELRNKSYDALKWALFTGYLTTRSTTIPTSLSYIYFDKIYLVSGLLLFISMWIWIVVLSITSISHNIEYSSQDKKISSFIKYWFYESFDKEKKTISKTSVKKLLWYILASELFIALFFLIDYLFGL